jgi:hypothetical protein
LACACGKKSQRGAQADARVASRVLDRGVHAVARGAARCFLYLFGHGAKTGACGRSFAVLSAQVSRVGLRLRHNRLTCGSILEVSRDAVAAEEAQCVSCTAEKSKKCFICAIAFGPCGDLPVTSWGRWKSLRGGADAGLNSFYSMSPAVAAQNIGLGPCRENTCGDMFEAIARIAPSQPNEARARTATRIPVVPMVNNKISLDKS